MLVNLDLLGVIKVVRRKPEISESTESLEPASEGSRRNILVIPDANIVEEEDNLMGIYDKQFPHLTKTVRGLIGMLWTNDRLRYGATRGLTLRLFPRITDELVDKLIDKGLIFPVLSDGGTVQYFDIVSMTKLVCYKKYGVRLQSKKQILEQVVNYELDRFQQAFEGGRFSVPIGDSCWYRKSLRSL